MLKLGTSNDLSKIIDISSEVEQYIHNVLSILDENYGSDRNVDTDMGGYVLIVENEKDIPTLADIIDNRQYEYRDDVNGYYAYMYLLTDEYAVVALISKDLYRKDW